MFLGIDMNIMIRELSTGWFSPSQWPHKKIWENAENYTWNAFSRDQLPYAVIIIFAQLKIA